LELLSSYGVTRCYYGHLHGESHRLAFQGVLGGTEFHLVSADYLNFCPKQVL
jgi:predicted phosphohydrolase